MHKFFHKQLCVFVINFIRLLINKETLIIGCVILWQLLQENDLCSQLKLSCSFIPLVTIHNAFILLPGDVTVVVVEIVITAMKTLQCI